MITAVLELSTAMLIIAAIVTAVCIKRFKVDGDILANVLTDVEILQAEK